MTEVTFGGYALPLVLSIVLSMVYKVVSVGDRFKAPIAGLCGIGLGFIGMLYQGKPWTMVNAVDFGLYGFMAGAGAVGLYEISRSAIRPRV